MTNIRIHGDIQRSFTFPAGSDAAFDYYADFPRLVGWLKHIGLVSSHDDHSYRLLYHTTELGVYGVNLFCDVEIVLDRAAGILRVQPLVHPNPVPARTTTHNLTAYGLFRSESIFMPQGAQTLIDYTLHLEAALPTPLAARLLLPGAVLEKIAEAITAHRMDEIVDEFIKCSLTAFGETASDR